jgi:hypothetical protein
MATARRHASARPARDVEPSAPASQLADDPSFVKLAALVFTQRIKLRESDARIEKLETIVASMSGKPLRRVPPARWLPAKRAAHIAGVSTQTIRNWAETWLIAGEQFDDAWFVSPSSLEAYLAKRNAK